MRVFILFFVKMTACLHVAAIRIGSHYDLATTDAADNFSNRRWRFHFARLLHSCLGLVGGRGSGDRVGSFGRVQNRR